MRDRAIGNVGGEVALGIVYGGLRRLYKLRLLVRQVGEIRSDVAEALRKAPGQAPVGFCTICAQQPECYATA